MCKGHYYHILILAIAFIFVSILSPFRSFTCIDRRKAGKKVHMLRRGKKERYKMRMKTEKGSDNTYLRESRAFIKYKHTHRCMRRKQNIHAHMHNHLGREKRGKEKKIREKENKRHFTTTKGSKRQEPRSHMHLPNFASMELISFSLFLSLAFNLSLLLSSRLHPPTLISFG